MEHLYERLAESVAKWRSDGHSSEPYPAIAEILDWAGETDEGELRFLRRPQLHALETYWYLRLVEGTAHVFDLYRGLFEGRAELLEALGISAQAFAEADYDGDRLWDLVRTDDEFVKRFQLHSLRETLALDYPSYILALAMGAGKTILIGAVIATEFAMAQEYADGPFVQNALVFAPGKTIIESLRELNEVPYDRILPPRMHKGFAASVKLTFTRDGEKEVPVVPGSIFNVVVTNTEKIRIRKEAIRKSEIGRLFDPAAMDQARSEVANARLTRIASLPQLAIFSDEAHHTYGQSLEKGLKKVRQTVDYLAQNTSLVCVINTTGTPYFKRQPLKDVVIWYGLSQGIRDGILKDVSDNIRGYDVTDDPAAYVAHVVQDFFRDYGEVRLPNGAPSKLAMYFPQTDDLKALRPVIDEALVMAGLSPTHALVNTSDATLTKQADIDAFNRLNDPSSPHRLVLLVNKGTEGWNCPSLFGCALARKLKTSNNFVLQAASRCLRQVPGNQAKARVYLSADNYKILDTQLAETYGETISSLNRQATERRTKRLVLRKSDVPPLMVTRVEHTVGRSDEALEPLALKRPAAAETRLHEHRYVLADQPIGRRILKQLEDTVEIATEPQTLDAYAASTELAAQYRLDLWTVYDEIRRLYGDKDVPLAHVGPLAAQIEDQTRDYVVSDETVEAALALVKPAGFKLSADEHGDAVYTTEIVYRKDREQLLLSLSDVEKWNDGEFGFHYDPYNFDSMPEKDFFDQVLRTVDVHPDEVEDVYFTGGITDPGKTDFFVEYRDSTGKWRRYTPDFVIRKKDGRVLIVEIKSERAREDPVNGTNGAKAMALKKWEELNTDRIRYEMIFTRTEAVAPDELAEVRAFIGDGQTDGSRLRIPINRAKIEEFCRKWKITELSFFGSVLRDDFRPDSDVDVLVAFAPEAHRSLSNEGEMENELREILGRNVDLVSKRAIEQSPNWIRRKAILESAEPYVVTR